MQMDLKTQDPVIRQRPYIAARVLQFRWGGEDHKHIGPITFVGIDLTLKYRFKHLGSQRTLDEFEKLMIDVTIKISTYTNKKK